MAERAVVGSNPRIRSRVCCATQSLIFLVAALAIVAQSRELPVRLKVFFGWRKLRSESQPAWANNRFATAIVIGSLGPPFCFDSHGNPGCFEADLA